MDVIFDQAFQIAGEDFPDVLTFNHVIFVMEDVDAATDIVLSREDTSTNSTTTASSTSSSLSCDSSERIIEEMMAIDLLTASKMKPSGESTTTATATTTTATATTATTTANKDSSDPTKAGKNEKDKKKETDTFGLFDILSSKAKSSDDKKSDKLDLSGLLNVLDGIVDTPGRMLIMTSNHPEKLDSALIRPGRIDKVIRLGYMEPEEAICMVEHYFDEELLEYQKAILFDVLKSGNSNSNCSSIDTTSKNSFVSENTKNKKSTEFTPAEVISPKT